MLFQITYFKVENIYRIGVCLTPIPPYGYRQTNVVTSSKIFFRFFLFFGL